MAFLAFALYILLLASGQLGRAGVSAQHFWPEWLAWNGTLLSLWPGAAMAAAVAFAGGLALDAAPHALGR